MASRAALAWGAQQEAQPPADHADDGRARHGGQEAVDAGYPEAAPPRRFG